jgi:exodeoxyribonuclease-3
MRVVTWNINSIRIRLDLVAQLARDWAPDVICLQETKCPDELFPREDLAKIGYPHQAIIGMKGYHGVAILSRLTIEKSGHLHWCDKEDCRHVYARLPGEIEIHNLYIPAGGDIPDPDENDKFAHKLSFLREQTRWWKGQGQARKRILVGDLNVAPLETDVWSHKQLLDVVSHTPIEVRLLKGLQKAHDWVDAVRHFVPAEQKLFSWWSYRARDWRLSDRGRRLDHVWVTPDLVERLKGTAVLKDARDWSRASDHVPIVVDLED